jgi:hypothetical protein
MSVFQSLDEPRGPRMRGGELAMAFVATSAGSGSTPARPPRQRPAVAVGVEALRFEKRLDAIAEHTRARGSASHHDQSTDQFAAVRQASGPKRRGSLLRLPATGVAS